MAAKGTPKNSKTNAIQSLRTTGSSKKMTSGKAFERPKLLFNESVSKVELLRQSNYLSSTKKTKTGRDLSALPPGVRKSIEEKERIAAALSFGTSNDIEDIRKRFLIEKKPLTKARATEIREERMRFFQNNIEKSKSGKSKLNSLNYGSDKDPIRKMREEEMARNSKKVQDSVAATKIKATGKSKITKAASTAKTTTKKTTSAAKKPAAKKTTAKK
ncbi:hypothetical protein [Spiroplasma monobiae]|uniref:Uncharacterized protein n=1 Tax=Spiroplasma monobiae MQ-1 TaxID=1336748 RepID=A0A2K9LUB5_SPISQ|nr:hypothetical protein [Spiroplasma monobiae]AUM62642.1 hypothetical protein SMONO_v1c03930 [Spiroplasma monobiae MQ-1]